MNTLSQQDRSDEPMMINWQNNSNNKYLMIPQRLGLFPCLLTVGLLLTASNVNADHATSMLAAVYSHVENTGNNTRDRGNANLTPEDQKETKGDIKITAAIRQAVTRIKSLSLDAHNAKIITRNGVVTLRGPVENPEEKAKLQKIAQKTKGVKQVDNQLEVKSP